MSFIPGNIRYDQDWRSGRNLSNKPQEYLYADWHKINSNTGDGIHGSKTNLSTCAPYF